MQTMNEKRMKMNLIEAKAKIENAFKAHNGIKAIDSKYNRIVNEGAEGFERTTKTKLNEEINEVESFGFWVGMIGNEMKVLDKETFMAIREKLNAKVAELKPKNLAEFEKIAEKFNVSYTSTQSMGKFFGTIK